MQPPSLLFHVAVSSGTPIYRQLFDQVLALVASGRLAPGDWLPAVRDVAVQLQINPMTVSKAYSLLDRDGVVERVRGHGMRVLPPKQAGGHKERIKQLDPLLDQVVAHAFQWRLDRNEVLQSLAKKFKESVND